MTAEKMPPDRAGLAFPPVAGHCPLRSQSPGDREAALPYVAVEAWRQADAKETRRA